MRLKQEVRVRVDGSTAREDSFEPTSEPYRLYNLDVFQVPFPPPPTASTRTPIPVVDISAREA